MWAKITPNVGNPTIPTTTTLHNNTNNISLINTILSVINIDLKTLQPIPTIKNHNIPNNYSKQSVQPIALHQIIKITHTNPKIAINKLNKIKTKFNTAQFFLLNASTVQICTGAMLRGYEIIDELKTNLTKFMTDHSFTNLRDFIGKSLPFFTSHHDLVDHQKSARDAKETTQSQSNHNTKT